MRNSFRLDGKKPNLYSIGLAPSSVGKSSIAREGLKVLQQLDRKIRDEFNLKLQDLEDGTAEITKSSQLMLEMGTREGLIAFLTRYLDKPAGLYFATGEFETFLANLAKDFNKGLASFFTELYDGDRVSEDCTISRLEQNRPLRIAEDTSVSIGGVSTPIYIASLGKKPV